MKFISEIGFTRLLLIVISGVALIWLSAKDFTGRSDNGKEDDNIQYSQDKDTGKAYEEDDYARKMEEKLTAVLSRVYGVGHVSVMITLKSSSEEVIQKDRTMSSEITDEQTNSKSEESTVYSEDGSVKEPYVVKEMKPQIMGVVVVSSGGGDPQVKKEIIEAVQVLFDIEPHKIKVMKQQ